MTYIPNTALITTMREAPVVLAGGLGSYDPGYWDDGGGVWAPPPTMTAGDNTAVDASSTSYNVVIGKYSDGVVLMGNPGKGRGFSFDDPGPVEWTYDYPPLFGAFGVSRAQNAGGENLTNNVTSGGTDGTIANFTNLTTYAADAATIRDDIYQLARIFKQNHDALRAYGLLT